MDNGHTRLFRRATGISHSKRRQAASFEARKLFDEFLGEGHSTFWIRHAKLLILLLLEDPSHRTREKAEKVAQKILKNTPSREYLEWLVTYLPHSETRKKAMQKRQLQR